MGAAVILIVPFPGERIRKDSGAEQQVPNSPPSVAGQPPEFAWIFLDFPGFSWIRLDSPGFSWILLDFPEFS